MACFNGRRIELLPLGVGRVNHTVGKCVFRAAKHGVEPVHIRLDVLGARFVAAGAVTQIQLGAFAQQLIHAARGMIRLLNRPEAFRGIIERRGNEAGPGRNAGQEFVLVDGQFVFAPGKEAQPRMQPVGKSARDVFDPFAKLCFREQAIAARAARAGAAGDDGGDALIQRGGDEGKLAVPRMAGERNPLAIHDVQCVEIINAPACRPCAAGEFGPVELRVERNKTVRVVARIRSGVNATDVAAAHCHECPRAVIVLRDEHRERPGAIGDNQFHMQLRLVLRAEFENHFLHRRAAFHPRLQVRRAHVAGRGGDGAEDVVEKHPQQFEPPFGPLLRCGHRLAVVKEQWIGQKRNAAQLVEIRREFPGRLQPFFPRLARGQEPAQLLAIRPLLRGRLDGVGARGQQQRGGKEQEVNPISLTVKMGVPVNHNCALSLMHARETRQLNSATMILRDSLR